MLYFSYGSNMSSKRLRKRIPAARLGVGKLYEHELRFHKESNNDGSAKCDAHNTGNSSHLIYGVVYEISEIHKTVLDEFEGLGFGYEIKNVQIHVEDTTISAFTYYATQINVNLKPLHWYKKHVLIGAHENALPDFYIQQIEKINSVADVDVNRHKKELKIYH